MAEAHRGERGKVCLPCSCSPYADIKHSFVLKTSTHTCFSNSISTLFSLNGKEAQQNPPKVYRLLTFSLIVQEIKTSHNPWHCNINKSHAKSGRGFEGDPEATHHLRANEENKMDVVARRQLPRASGGRERTLDDLTFPLRLKRSQVHHLRLWRIPCWEEKKK